MLSKWAYTHFVAIIFKCSAQFQKLKGIIKKIATKEKTNILAKKY